MRLGILRHERIARVDAAGKIGDLQVGKPIASDMQSIDHKVLQPAHIERKRPVWRHHHLEHPHRLHLPGGNAGRRHALFDHIPVIGFRIRGFERRLAWLRAVHQDQPWVELLILGGHLHERLILHSGVRHSDRHQRNLAVRRGPSLGVEGNHLAGPLESGSQMIRRRPIDAPGIEAAQFTLVHGGPQVGKGHHSIRLARRVKLGKHLHHGLALFRCNTAAHMLFLHQRIVLTPCRVVDLGRSDYCR